MTMTGRRILATGKWQVNGNKDGNLNIISTFAMHVAIIILWWECYHHLSPRECPGMIIDGLP